MSELYNQLTVIPQVGLSDHEAVIMCPTGRGVRCVVKHEVEWVCSHDPNKALFVHTLHKVNWAPLYKVTSCKPMVNLFYCIILSLLDQYMPLRPRLRNLNDKPWVTEEFCAVIWRRQYAWVNRQYADYRCYRNQIMQPVCDEYLTSTFQVSDELIISPEMVFARLERINVYKATGPDSLPNWVLRDFASR